ncbi:hypothetical protein ACLKA7_007314 [Drosophila subpalustris]
MDGSDLDCKLRLASCRAIKRTVLNPPTIATPVLLRSEWPRLSPSLSLSLSVYCLGSKNVAETFAARRVHKCQAPIEEQLQQLEA